MGSIWGRQDPGGPHVGPMNFAIWACCENNIHDHHDSSLVVTVNKLCARQNGRHFPDDIFERIFLNKNVWILIRISLKFGPKGPINNISASVQRMAWCRPGHKRLSEPMMISLLMHITRPQWVNTDWLVEKILTNIANLCGYLFLHEPFRISWEVLRNLHTDTPPLWIIP